MKLYGSNLSPFVQRVKIQAAVKGLALELSTPPGGGIKSPEYLAINPMGKMPALATDEGLHLPESEVIMEYLEDAFPKPALRPRKPEERALMRLISRVNELYVGPAMNRMFGLMNPAARTPEAVEAALKDVNAGLRHLEHYLSGKRHAAGSKFTLADCSITPSLFFITRILPAFGVKAPLKPYPKLARYWKARDKHPESAAAIGEMAEELKARFGI